MGRNNVSFDGVGLGWAGNFFIQYSFVAWYNIRGKTSASVRGYLMDVFIACHDVKGLFFPERR